MTTTGPASKDSRNLPQALVELTAELDGREERWRAARDAGEMTHDEAVSATLEDRWAVARLREILTKHTDPVQVYEYSNTWEGRGYDDLPLRTHGQAVAALEHSSPNAGQLDYHVVRRLVPGPWERAD